MGKKRCGIEIPSSWDSFVQRLRFECVCFRVFTGGGDGGGTNSGEGGV